MSNKNKIQLMFESSINASLSVFFIYWVFYSPEANLYFESESKYKINLRNQ